MEKIIELHSFQDQAIFAKERFVALVAGLQSGKTIAGCIWARKMMVEFPKNDGLIAAPTYKILTQSTLPKFFEINPDLKKYFKKGDGVIEIPNRGKVYIRSTDNPNVIEGMTLRWIWADEAGQMKLDAWINFQGRLSILEGELFITTTPYTLNWLYTDLYQKAKDNVQDYKVVQFRSKDNPYFPDEEYDRVKGTMDSRTFRRRYDGLFENMEGLVYQDFVPNMHTKNPEPQLKMKEFICGIDWGYNHPTAIIVIGVDSDGGYWIVDEYYKSGKTTAELIEKMNFFKDKYKIRFWYADPAEPDRIEEMRRSGLNSREVNKSKGSVRIGIDKLSELFKTNRLHIGHKCIHVLDEISTYHYPDPDSDKREDPVKENDDAMDAIRYAIMTYDLKSVNIHQFKNISVKRYK